MALISGTSGPGSMAHVSSLSVKANPFQTFEPGFLVPQAPRLQHHEVGLSLSAPGHCLLGPALPPVRLLRLHDGG